MEDSFKMLTGEAQAKTKKSPQTQSLGPEVSTKYQTESWALKQASWLKTNLVGLNRLSWLKA